MARFKSYLNEEPATIYQIADDVAEIELALKNKTQRKQFLKIVRRYNKNFDKLEG